MRSICCGMLLAGFAALAAENWTPLFNGRDLTGWTNVNCAPSTWTMRDGIIVSTGIPTGVLRTLRQYENFILELEWKHIKPGGNAGLFVWSAALTARGQPFTQSIEVQILDGRNSDTHTSHGDVFAIHGATLVPDRPHPKGAMRSLPSERRARPAGEWNHYRVECKDGRIALAVNGKFVSGGSNCVPRKGFICLESEGSECHFRNVRIQELPSSGAPAQIEEGFRSLYTGVDLSGWKQDAGHQGHWVPKDWILEYDGKGEAPDANLWSEMEFGDFVLIIDCRFPRKPQMPKLPVTLRNVSIALKEELRGGQWNRFIFTRKGDRLTVALNEKTVIESAPIPNVPARGPIALQHHGEPIQFANIYIKELSRSKVALAPGKGIKGPFGTEIDPAGNIYFVEMTSDRLCKLDPQGTVTLLSTNLDGPHNLALAPDGAIYIADTWKHRVQKFDTKSGMMTTIAGTGEKGFSGDGGPATSARFDGIHCVSLAGSRLYLADLANRRIRVIDLKTGIVKTVAGNGQKGVPQDGAVAIEAPLVDPRAVIADEQGNIYILERSGHALRAVDPKGRIRTLVGTGQKGFSGDGGDAKQATMNGPKHLCFDLDGNILIADTENHVIRKYAGKDGTIVRVAGSGRKGKGGLNGPPLDVELSQPHGVLVHRDGALYIADSSNDRILKVQSN